MNNSYIIAVLKDHGIDTKIENGNLMAHEGYYADRSEMWTDVTGFDRAKLMSFLNYDVLEEC